jgi:hypothetical protein
MFMVWRRQEQTQTEILGINAYMHNLWHKFVTKEDTEEKSAL